MASNNNSKAVKIQEFSLPQGELGRKVLITAIVMLLSARRELLEPGSPLHDYVLAGNPSLLRAARWIQNGLFYFLFGAHSVETPLGKSPLLESNRKGPHGPSQKACSSCSRSFSPRSLPGLSLDTNFYYSKFYSQAFSILAGIIASKKPRRPVSQMNRCATHQGQGNRHLSPHLCSSTRGDRS